ncbi:MAG: CPBP family intramembrane metalloprotease [Bacteroidaceae bacterium]|nr:CPBP family intramembrane metalloprotease [Bacteroidaceae bacterium]
MILKAAILCLALGVLWQLIILLLTSLFDAPNTDPRESYTLATLILHIFSFAIIGPIAEELFLRKWYISMMERASFSKIAIVVSNALVFYAAHVGTSFWRLDTLIMAVILCLMYMRTRDVRYCVITHVTCNLIGIFSAYYFV